MMMLTEEERVKRREEFLVRFGGAMLGGLEDAALEGYHKAYLLLKPRTFPYTQLHPNLPYNDDLIVGGLAIPPWVIGALMEEDGKKKGDMKAKELGRNVKMFGEGDAIYAFNMLIHHTVMRIPDPDLMVIEKRVVSRRPAAGAGSRRPDVGHRIIKL